MSRSFVSDRVRAVPPSGIRRFFDAASAYQGAISLGVGEPDFVTPYHIRNAAIDSLLEGETQYTPNLGLPELRREIAHYMAARFDLNYEPKDEIMVTVGASEAIDLALRATVGPGDEVIVPDPGYVSYSPCVTLTGAETVPLRTYARDGFAMTAENLERAITPRTRALIFLYPNNPTGGVMPADELAKIAQVCVRHDLLVISDEIYAELTYEGRHLSIGTQPGMKERTLVINGFSKAFAMTGWRLGYVCGPAEVIGAMNKIHQYTIMCAARQAQVAGIEALKAGRMNGYQDVIAMRDSYNRRRRLMLRAFEEMGLDCFEPKGAFYCFPSIESTGLTSEAFCVQLLEEEKVICVPGSAFGTSGEGHVRCCYATDVNQMQEAFKRMSAFVRRYQKGE